MKLVERCVRYVMEVECNVCGDAVYPREDDARSLVERLIKYDGLMDIEGLKARLERICDHCDHVLAKDD